MVPSVLILPKDIQDENYEEPAVAHGFTRSGVGYSKPKIVPEDADLAKAAEILNAGNKVAILIGAGARGTAPLLIEMATLLGAGVAKALLGKDVLPDDLPFVTGAIGSARHRAKLGPDARLRYALDGRDRLPLVRIPAQGRRRPRRADRYRSVDAFAAVSRRSQSSRRCRRYAEGVASPDPAARTTGIG